MGCARNRWVNRKVDVGMQAEYVDPLSLRVAARAERTLVIWEQHVNFVPISAVPQCQWVERDENQIAMLVHRADQVLERLRSFA